MVHIVLTAKGLEEVVNSLKAPGTLWLNAGVASAEQVADLNATGWNVTTWSIPGVDFEDQNDREGAIATVWEHHPNSTIWVEHDYSQTDEVE